MLLDSTALDRFWAKVNKDGPIPPHCPELGPCWVWMAHRNSKGYGRLGFQGRVQGAHRVIWQHIHGPIPAGMFVCHHCDNPGCVNDGHLFLGDAHSNMKDCARKGRISMVRNHGEDSNLHKLTACNVLDIRSRLTGASGELTALAREFSVSRCNIALIRDGSTWCHLLHGGE